MTADAACVSFRLGNLLFALPLGEVREIVTAEGISPVPLAPGFVRGIANIRGGVVTLLDVARMFHKDLPPVSRSEDRLALVLDQPYEHLAIYVHSPVEITTARSSAVPTRASGRGPSAAGYTPATPGHEDTDGLGVPVETSGEVAHMLSTADLVRRCQQQVLEGFRKNP